MIHLIICLALFACGPIVYGSMVHFIQLSNNYKHHVITRVNNIFIMTKLNNILQKHMRLKILDEDPAKRIAWSAEFSRP